MSTLLELITRTKGIEYLLVIAFLFVYVAFWQWQRHRGKGLAAKTVPMVFLALLFMGLASTCIGTPVAATPRVEEWPNVDDAHYLANIYGPAKFAAHEMGPNIVSCQTCHHHSPDGQPLPCKQCHTAPFSDETPSKPGLKAAYHQRCTDCHKEAFSGPMTCTKCHSDKPESENLQKDSPSPAVAPAIAHSLLEPYGNCFTCHRPEGPLPLPGNHSNYRANVECLGCHKPALEGQVVAMVPVVRAEVTAPRPTPTLVVPPTPASVESASPPAGRITHAVAGRENCLMCHGQGVGGATRVPDNHAGRLNESCQLCHKA